MTGHMFLPPSLRSNSLPLRFESLKAVRTGHHQSSFLLSCKSSFLRLIALELLTFLDVSLTLVLGR